MQLGCLSGLLGEVLIELKFIPLRSRIVVPQQCNFNFLIFQRYGVELYSSHRM
jgi:hypothetical protein